MRYHGEVIFVLVITSPSYQYVSSDLKHGRSILAFNIFQIVILILHITFTIQMMWADSKARCWGFLFYDSACEWPGWRKRRRACLTLFPLSIHYAIKFSFVDDANEAYCIPVRVSRSGKQTSAPQLKGKIGEPKEDIQAFSGLGPECIFFSAVLLAECVLTVTK